MPRRRQRKTNRRRPDERRLRVRGARRDPPDAKKLSRAFIGLALARAQAEADAKAQGVQTSIPEAVDTGTDNVSGDAVVRTDGSQEPTNDVS